jgi:hypothetical protein
MYKPTTEPLFQNPRHSEKSNYVYKNVHPAETIPEKLSIFANVGN